VHKINGSDGSIIWRLNGKRSDFDMGDGTPFCFQHHARWLSHSEGPDIELISLYDNSAHGTEHNDGHEVHTAPTSSGKILRLDTAAWTAELVGGYFPPDGLLSKSQGSTQVLPGGNVVVGWGSEGAVTEFTSDGEAVFHAYMDSGALGVGVQNYRAFRFNWTGLPNEEPAIVALAGGEGTTVYVSWNGDTETRAWRFYQIVDGYGSREFLGEVERTSFETSLFIAGKTVAKVSADAVDGSGRTLRTTALVETEPEVLPAKKDKSGSVQVGYGNAEKVLAKPASRWEDLGILKFMRGRMQDL